MALVTTGIADAIAVASEAAGYRGVALMGGVLTSALEADLVDEVIPAPGVTHLHHEVVR